MKIALNLYCVALLVLGACASKKEITAVESVEVAKKGVDVTENYIEKANKEMQDFQKELTDLSKDATKSKEMRGKERFSRVLNDIGPRIDQARAELQQMKAANKTTWEIYKSRLEHADAQLQNSFTNMLNENAPAE